MTPRPRFSVILRPYDPDDTRLQELARKSTSNTVVTGGKMSALTFLFRFTMDTAAEGGVVELSVHTNTPLSYGGQHKLEDHSLQLRQALEACMERVPSAYPLMRENTFWVTVDVQRGAPSDRRATVLAGSDFSRAARAIEAAKVAFERDFSGLRNGLRLLWPFNGSERARRDLAAGRILEESARQKDAEQATGFDKSTAAVTFRHTLQETAGALLASVYAANLTPKERAAIQERGRDPGRFTRFFSEPGVLVTPTGKEEAEEAPKPPRLATQFVEPVAEQPASSPIPHRPTLVALELDEPDIPPPPKERAPVIELRPPPPPIPFPVAATVTPGTPGHIPTSPLDPAEPPAPSRIAPVKRDRQPPVRLRVVVPNPSGDDT